MSRTANQTLKTAVAVAFLATAGIIYARRGATGADDAAPNTPESATHWYCRACRQGFGLTAREYDERVAFGIDRSSTVAEGRARPVAMAPCPKCKALAVRGRRCPTDGTIYEMRGADGSEAKCPKCTPAGNGLRTAGSS